MTRYEASTDVNLFVDILIKNRDLTNLNQSNKSHHTIKHSIMTAALKESDEQCTVALEDNKDLQVSLQEEEDTSKATDKNSIQGKNCKGKKKGKDKRTKSKEELWKDATEKEISDDGTCLQLDGMSSKTHTVYARVYNKKDPTIAPKVTVGYVLEQMVDDEWKLAAKEILEKHKHYDVDTYPSAQQLLKLGAVWLLNETMWTAGDGAHAHRLTAKDEETTPNWIDFTVRIYAMPERYHAANDVDWSKPCKGLLLQPRTVEVVIGGEVPPVSIMEAGLPDEKDGVVVYKDKDLGFAVLNKPGNVPDHPTLSNHSENVVDKFAEGLKKIGYTNFHVTLPPGLCCESFDTQTQGLIVASIKNDFAHYVASHFSKLVNTDEEGAAITESFMTKVYKCLVGVKDTGRMNLLEDLKSKGTIVTHYVNIKSPAPKHFYRHKPNNPNPESEWQKCQLRILQVGDGSNFRAACVNSDYPESIDACLGHRLWGSGTNPSKDLGIRYVMEVQVELLTTRSHQIRGQLASMGFPIVGDVLYGGGKSEYYSHKHHWNRLALQCSALYFKQPKWEEETKTKNNESDPEDCKKKNKSHQKRELVPSDTPCEFRLHTAWWTPYLQQYELYHQSY